MKLRGAEWNEIRPPEHIVMHSKTSLTRLAEGAGLEMLDFSTHPRFTVSPPEVRGCLPGPTRNVAGTPLQEPVIAAYDRLFQYPILACWLRKLG